MSVAKIAGSKSIIDLLPVLSGADLKLLLYIAHHIDRSGCSVKALSYDELIYGCMSNGMRMDQGTRLSKPTLIKALRTLRRLGLLHVAREQCNDLGRARNAYTLTTG